MDQPTSEKCWSTKRSDRRTDDKPRAELCLHKFCRDAKEEGEANGKGEDWKKVYNWSAPQKLDKKLLGALHNLDTLFFAKKREVMKNFSKICRASIFLNEENNIEEICQKKIELLYL